MQRLLSRSVWLPALVIGALLLISLSLLLAFLWRGVERLEPVHAHRVLIDRMTEETLRLGDMLLEAARTGTRPSTEVLRQRSQELARLNATDGYLAPETPARMQALQRDLAALSDGKPPEVANILALTRDLVLGEFRAHELLLAHIYEDERMEVGIVTGTIAGLLLLAALLLLLLRRRVMLPLRNLRLLMSTLGQRDYREAPRQGVDPLLLPLFDNYNHLARRLAELEDARARRQHSLEQEVRTATAALLEQQRDLANAERLAAVGEVAAGLAHELRNPLAGIQMSLSNLRADIDSTEQAERLDLVIADLRRITRLLNDLLSETRQAPELAADIHLATVVGELLTLARYQLPPQVRLVQSIPDTLRCRLPEGRLRQALLNLVLNAAEALGERPGSITIGAEKTERDLRLSVADDGPGLPRELLESGVRPFSTGREQGTGLGLALVRRFARDLGGELHLTNREPHGACVMLLLPCKEPGRVGHAAGH